MAVRPIEKKPDHSVLEESLYKSWLDVGLFASKTSKSNNNFSIIMPPPNVTGTLHIGHALNMTIQDILIRFWRMNGKDVLWQPGTDHAGIATQKIVETKLHNEKNINKKDIGKTRFLKEIWDWKEESGNKIINQIKRLGASPDWERLRFTLDNEMTNAVTHAFIELYKKGFIYRDKRLVNWDISLQTAVSDLEVEQIEREGEFFYLKYFLEDKSEFLTVATTRPETLFGDQCLAVNSHDERYKKFIGKKVFIPITNELIPIISDESVDQEKGSGVLKITPAHDFNDYKVGKKNNLKLKVIFDKYGKLNQNVPLKYQGVDRIKSRKLILEDLNENDNLLKIEKIQHAVPYGDRSGSIIEPYLTDQWFLNVKPLADQVVNRVKEGETKFFPSSWSNTFFSWMDDIEPWCISRQIWWGHRIPIWYGPDGNTFYANNQEEAQKKADKFYNKNTVLRQETDVLDTWFSSALWPMSTLGWPNEKDNYYKKYFPTSLLVTGFDIIFFWVARMMMMSVYFTNKMPFKEVYIHALVRDKDGNKMSKSKGNVINPLRIIDKFGADALRFTLSLMAAQGRDIKLSEDNVLINRNFITKIRSAYNYLNKNKCFEKTPKKVENLILDENIWISKLLNDYILSIEKNIKNYKFNEAAKDIYKFVKSIFCDWYLEFIKINLNKKNNKVIKEEIQFCAKQVFINILKIAHPFMPFTTDDIFVNYLGYKDYLSKQSWPSIKYKDLSKKKFSSINDLMKIITSCRNIKANLKIEPRVIIDIYYITLENINVDYIKKYEEYINVLGRVKLINTTIDNEVSKNFMKFVNDKLVFYVDRNNIENENLLSKDMNILNEQLLNINKDITVLKNKVENKEFINKAPLHVVEKFKKKMKDKKLLKDKILNQINSL
ncbi:MAG: valine--tRNA ligase [Rickettsiales bacterium]|nr:valine--tRNA ligase [Rickettsiales bacterium]OUV79811.1 MAG: valine--tRNA ligase [Rickettsiales bacterium TMED131]